jgi:hypothetical protein
LPDWLGRLVDCAALAQQPGQCVAQHGADGMVIVLGGPAQRSEQLGGERRRRIEHRSNGAQTLRGDVGGGGMLDDEADTLATPERHADAAANWRQ